MAPLPSRNIQKPARTAVPYSAYSRSQVSRFCLAESTKGSWQVNPSPQTPTLMSWRSQKRAHPRRRPYTWHRSQFRSWQHRAPSTPHRAGSQGTAPQCWSKSWSGSGIAAWTRALPSQTWLTRCRTLSYSWHFRTYLKVYHPLDWKSTHRTGSQTRSRFQTSSAFGSSWSRSWCRSWWSKFATVLGRSQAWFWRCMGFWTMTWAHSAVLPILTLTVFLGLGLSL